MFVSADREAEISLYDRPIFLLMYADDIVVLSRSAEHAQLTIDRVYE